MTRITLVLLLLLSGCGNDRPVATPDQGPAPDQTLLDSHLPDPDIDHSRDWSEPDSFVPDPDAGRDTGADTTKKLDIGGTCAPPSYPSDCSQVSYFQCGFMFNCVSGTIQVEWHEHVFCPDMEQIHSYKCAYACPNGCNSGYAGWPQSGSELVQQACNP